jgi:hypothetical protein
MIQLLQESTAVTEDKMQRVENAFKMKDEQFKRILGTTKAVFQQMLTVLQLACCMICVRRL